MRRDVAILALALIVLLLVREAAASAGVGLHALGEATSVLHSRGVAQRVPLAATASAAECAAAQYPSQCLSLPGCQWCCEGVTDTPCFRPHSDYELARAASPQIELNASSHSGDLWPPHTQAAFTRTSCSPRATLVDANETCDAVCARHSSTCAACEQLSWCLYCSSTSLCVAPTAHCPKNAYLQQCEAPEETPDPDLRLWQVVTAVAVGAVLGTGILLAGVCAVSCLRNRRRQQQLLEARQRRREMRQQQRQRDQETLQQLQQRQQQRHPELAQAAPATEPHTQPHSQPAQDIAEDEDAAGERQPLLHAEESEPGPRSPEGSPLAGNQPLQPQEIAAPGVASAPSQSSFNLDDESLCYLCLDARPSVAFLPCYHACCCEACSNRLRPRAAEVNCPFCRRRIEAMVSLSSILHVAERDGPA